MSAQQQSVWPRLESIFLPSARRARDNIYQPDGNHRRFVHYTTAEAALKIIQTKRLWMRNTNCMADFREVQHGFEILNRFFSDKGKSDAFNQALESCSPGAAQEAITLFNGWWNDVRLNTYIACFSEHDQSEDLHGRLSMWRAFGGNTARVAMVLKIPADSPAGTTLNVLFNPVTYLSEPELHAELDQVIQNINRENAFLKTINRIDLITSVFYMLIGGAVCLKHEGFREEREWRAIYSPNRSPSALMQPSIEVVNGVPQTVYKVPIDASVSQALADIDISNIVERLIVGPSAYPWVMYSAFSRALADAGVPNADARVWTSGIPIRS
jgi:Protein of unknown function (DUF2971)